MWCPQSLCRGSGDSMYTRKTRATREAPWRGDRITNRKPVRDRPGALGWRRGSYDLGSRVMPVEERDLSSRQTQDVGKDRRLGNLSTPSSVQRLQRALHAKAKAEPGFRFYALYDKMYREDILAYAYARCRANKGAPGVDRQDFAAVEAYGRERWLGELALALREESYRPEPIKRVFIPKANGKLRPLGVPTLRDRVGMTAAVLVLEPIYEADLPSEQYAYRPGRSAQQAVVEVEETLFRSHPDVVDADLSDYFGSIPHAELLKSVARRIVDRRVLHLIKQWLECPVEETDKRGRKTRTTEAKDICCGIPQGGLWKAFHNPP